MSRPDVTQLRSSATRAAAEEIACGHGDDDIDEAVTHYLLTYGLDDLTLGELRKIAAEAHKTATVAARSARTNGTSEGTRQ
jgi:hypothetical protein